MGENWQYGMKVEFQVTKILADQQMSRCHMKYVETPCHGKVLMMDGEVQFSTSDEERYGKMMTQNVTKIPHSMNQPPLPEPSAYTAVDILILGGGDGLLARDFLKHCFASKITIVDWDAKFVAWASENIAENIGSLKNPRVRVLDMDVRDPRVIEEGKKYDVVVLDLPDPDSKEMQELYMYVVKKVLPAVAKTHVTVKAHVGPAVTTNKKHPNWAFIETFQLDMENAFYKSGRRTEYTLDSDYIPSYMHEWGFVTCVAWKDPKIAQELLEEEKRQKYLSSWCDYCEVHRCDCPPHDGASSGGAAYHRSPSPSCCSDADDEYADLPPLVPIQSPNL